MGQSTSIPTYVGYIAMAVSCFFYGSELLPVKQYETGDGVFFQWVFCSYIAFLSSNHEHSHFFTCYRSFFWCGLGLVFPRNRLCVWDRKEWGKAKVSGKCQRCG